MIDISKIYQEYGAWKDYKRTCDELKFSGFSGCHDAVVAAKVGAYKRILYGNGGRMMSEKDLRRWLDNCKSVYYDLCKIEFSVLDESLFYNARTVIQTLCFVLEIDFAEFLGQANIFDPVNEVDEMTNIDIGVK